MNAHIAGLESEELHGELDGFVWLAETGILTHEIAKSLGEEVAVVEPVGQNPFLVVTVQQLAAIEADGSTKEADLIRPFLGSIRSAERT